MIVHLDFLSPLAVIVVHRRFATRSLRELKRLEGITKSPVYARFSSDMAGTSLRYLISMKKIGAFGHYYTNVATYTTPLKVSSPYARIKHRDASTLKCCSSFTKTPPRGSGGSLVCSCSFDRGELQTWRVFRRRLTTLPSFFYVFQATAGLDFDWTSWPHMS